MQVKKFGFSGIMSLIRYMKKRKSTIILILIAFIFLLSGCTAAKANTHKNINNVQKVLKEKYKRKKEKDKFYIMMNTFSNGLYNEDLDNIKNMLSKSITEKKDYKESLINMSDFISDDIKDYGEVNSARECDIKSIGKRQIQIYTYSITQELTCDHDKYNITIRYCKKNEADPSKEGINYICIQRNLSDLDYMVLE